MKIQVNDNILLEPLEEKHAEPIFNLVNTNRAHLGEWLPWVSRMRTVDDFMNFIQEAQRKAAKATDLTYAIIFNNELAGRIGMYNIDHENKSTSIGYWLGSSFEGKGIITKACKTLLAHCFNELGMNRVEIRCGTTNFKSQAVPEKLGFKKEGIIRQGEFVGNQFIDLYFYALLKHEQETTD